MSTPPLKSIYSRANPFPAKVTEVRPLNKKGSEKDTRHYVVDLSGAQGGLTYNAGDSLGIVPQSYPETAAELLTLLSLDPLTPVPAITPAGTQAPLKEVLINSYTLNRVSKKFVKCVADKLIPGANKEELLAICADDEALTNYCDTRDYVDVLRQYGAVPITAEELPGLINKSNPRLYSIASSGKVHPTQVHLTVAIVRYTTHDRQKSGLATGYLADLVKVNETQVPVYVQPTRHFHLPELDKDMIMVGPGTGIAPFRAFLQERALTKASGRNWLFYGDQRQATDFLYEEEFAEYQKTGVLTKFDTAFSRDQAQKIYVQTRMRENGLELWNWLQSGAYFYICGDAKRMAKDVHQALIDIAREHGGLSEEQSKEYVEVTLTKTEKRYLKDVY
jgi:sulfite reductase (NADPH) flavoprotein alpha-component